MKIKFFLPVIVLLLLTQGCMSVSIRMSGGQSGCINDIKYSGADGFIYDPVLRNLMLEKNSVLETSMKQYPESYTLYLESREALQNAELKSMISAIVQLTGSVVVIASACNWRQSGWLEWMLTGFGVGAAGFVINLMAIPEMFDSCNKLGKAIDRYNSHCY